MPKFKNLTVKDIRNTIKDAVVLTLEPDDNSAFDFTQGQYLTFRRDFDGEELRRSYSICAGKQDGVLQVGIKRVDGGAFSTWANEDLQIGDRLEALPPMGTFFAQLDPNNEKSYLGFAGGSGITPVLSLIKTTLNAEPKSRFTLIYANKSVTSIMFREELEDLKNRHMGRFNVIHVLETDSQGVDLFTGMVTQEKCASFFELGLINAASVDLAFICGPEPMMLGIAAALRDAGLTDDQIKYELFASGQPGRAKRKATSKNAQSAGQKTTVSITVDGTTQSVESNGDTSILDAGLSNALDLPYACKAGVCSTCKCRVIEGEVEMIANHALEDYEGAAGYVLSCQSYPLTDAVSVDYDS